MDRQHKRTMALPGGVNWAEIEFEWELPQPERPTAKKTAEPTAVTPPKKKARRGGRGRQALHRYRIKKWERKQALKRRIKELARIVAFDLLEMRAMNFEENEIKFREQQQHEAKVYSENLAAAFREAVKEAANAAN